MIEGYGTFATGHVWLGIDPGLTTGVAILSDEGVLIGSANLHHETVGEDLDELIRRVHRGAHTIDVVQERLPRVGNGSLANTIAAVQQAIYEVTVDIYELPKHEVLPGEWKPSRVAKTFRPTLSKSMSAHEKDAACMTKYVIERGPVKAKPLAVRRGGRKRLEDTPQRISQRRRDEKRRLKRKNERLERHGEQ